MIIEKVESVPKTLFDYIALQNSLANIFLPLSGTTWVDYKQE